jgi:dolichyl-phosphate beta-glucosyltransferase
MKYAFSIVVPVYNETSRLLDGFRQISDAVRKQKTSVELILVDDGSDVSTEEYLRSSSLKRRVNEMKRNKQLFFIRLPENRGKGAAITQGMLEAKGTHILFTDIDCSVPMTFIPDLLASLNVHDVAIGSRRLPDSVIVVHQPFIRETAGKIYTFLSNWICQLHVSDATCGFKAFKRNAAKKIFSQITVKRWSFDAEVLFIARKQALLIAEVPVSWTNKTGSRVKARDSIQSFWELCVIKWNDYKGRYTV